MREERALLTRDLTEVDLIVSEVRKTTDFKRAVQLVEDYANRRAHEAVSDALFEVNVNVRGVEYKAGEQND